MRTFCVVAAVLALAGCAGGGRGGYVANDAESIALIQSGLAMVNQAGQRPRPVICNRFGTQTICQ
jgi:hypothetical protein